MSFSLKIIKTVSQSAISIGITGFQHKKCCFFERTFLCYYTVAVVIIPVFLPIASENKRFPSNNSFELYQFRCFTAKIFLFKNDSQ